KFITTPSISYKIWERGISPGFNQVNGGITTDVYNVGDKFVVERDVANGEMKYYKNKRLLHISTITTSPAMVVDATLNSLNAAIDDARTTFGCPPPDPAYVKLFRKPNSGFYNAKNKTIRFTYFEEYNDLDAQGLKYRVYDKTGDPMVDQIELPHAVAYGDNRVTLNFSNIMKTLTIGDFYLLEVENMMKEKWYLRFIAL
ncbi:MAG: hypothetical protein JKY52_20805, partial [Flavobacteriales bacterium]|nr:hypothetical protein [Flavobacteriales bacterium]